MTSPLRGPISETCPVCAAKPGQPCTSIIRADEPLPGRIHHIGRSETTHYCLRCGIPHQDGKCQR